MKNYWLERRKSRMLTKRYIGIIVSKVKKKLWINALKGGLLWPRKDTKIQQ